MKRRLVGAGMVLGLALLLAAPAQAALDDFKLTRAIPADAMLAVHARNHAGLDFLNEQYARLWAEFEKQHFDRDLKKILLAAKRESEGPDLDVEAFEKWWQQVTDLAAGVEWSGLLKQEWAFAMKLTPPQGVDFLMLCMPPKDRVGEDFNGLAAIFTAIAEQAGEQTVTLSKEGEGARAVHKLAIIGVPFTVTLARHDEVLLLGFGTAMPEQSLALLRGGSGGSTLAGSERFKEAFKGLPPPVDSLMFVDMSRLLGQARVFAQQAVALTSGGETADSESATTRPASPFSFLPPLVDELSLWEYVAAVAQTDGMKTTSQSVMRLKEGARSQSLGKVLYGGKPVREPLRYVPIEASWVSAFGGLDVQALYPAVTGFIRKHVADGENLLKQWDEMKATLPIDIEQDLLSWVGGGAVMFSAPIPTAFAPGWVVALEVRDAEKAAAALAKLEALANENLAAQSAGVEDAEIEGLPGFKRVVLPPQLALMAGRPVYGLKDGKLFLANGPEVVQAAFETAAGKHDNFSKNERYKAEGLPIPDNVAGFSFSDLTDTGKQLSQALSMVAMVPAMVPGLTQNQAASTAIFAVAKLGKVLAKLDFLKSSCAITTMDGDVQTERSVTNYQRPPQGRTSETAEATPGEKPEKAEQTEGKAPQKTPE